ncbi:hypothetical protein [Glycomyces buryatensis]|uniref:Uncharacterized protein n=1 Tax=Glycomyces buryatensis TaxID=2570927 RepID=A0A4S8QEE6_9ACTN|nr:hypothetical protein [Glycomyces buryatensis]THV42710.1 hypothetical protein FAB82_04815 [Glycomyces buryatensis]
MEETLIDFLDHVITHPDNITGLVNYIMWSTWDGNPRLTPADANVIMAVMHSIDPTESGVAASVRDTIRDNTELTV